MAIYRPAPIAFFFRNVFKYKVVSKPNEKVKYETVSTPVQREVEYPAYSNWLDFDINAPSYQRKLRRDGPGIILLRVLQTFRSENKRDPHYKTRTADIALLEQIRDELAPNSTLTSDALGLLFAQISPAVAVVGGVVAQEVIKVVTKMEAPHRNLFIFNPETCVGYVEAIGVN